MFTDTSREMAAYEQALRKAGMSTLDDDFTLKESASALKSTQKHEVTVDDTSMQGTGAFGMKPLAPKDTGQCAMTFLLVLIFTVCTHPE